MPELVIKMRDRGAQRALDRLAAPKIRALGRTIGKILVKQSERRISSEKTDPDGKRWKPAKLEGDGGQLRDRKGRYRGRGLLLRSGGLLDSLRHGTQGERVYVGSDLAYAAVHQLGSDGATDETGTVPRAFLGVSGDNKAEIVDAVELELAKFMGAA